MGIAGSGASACAAIAHAQGFEVSGCDTSLESEFLDNLPVDIKITEAHSSSHLQNVEILAISPAIESLDADNPELIKARQRGIKVMTWQQFMGKYLTKGKNVIAVCGTHGKSTTTAMLGKILEDGGMDPTVLLGAIIPPWGKNFRIGESKYFVIEADEFNDNFLSLTSEIAVVTNIEYDHPEYFSSYTDYQRSFQNFLHKTKSLIIANLSDKGIQETLADERVQIGKFLKPMVDFSANLIDFPLKISGLHNILNASAAYHASMALNVNPKVVKKSLEQFEGIGRRMEEIGTINGAKIFSDFGHHPTEVETTVKAFKDTFPDKKVWLIYQPHMYTRTKALFNEFVKSFKNLEVAGAIIIDIYASREKENKQMSSKLLTQAINLSNIEYVPNIRDVFNEIKENLSENDIVIFMGAGDIDKEIRKQMSSRT